MTTWVALLRGVNVGGITIRSEDLADLFRARGFEDVTTFLASGNVRFETDAAASGRAALKTSIERALRERFAYDAWIVLITLDELRAAVAAFPFDASAPDRQPYVVFCSDPAVHEDLVRLAAECDPVEDPVRPGKGVVYWFPEKGRSTGTSFAKLLGRARYRATTTSRNLRTLLKIVV